MNPVVLYFASGESLYSGGTLLFFAIAASPLLRETWQLRLRNIAAWLGLVLMVMASPPFSLVIASVFLGAFILWFSVECCSGYAQRRATWSTASRVLLAVLVIVLCSVGFCHRREPRIVGFRNDQMVVIGDSISAGLDPAHRFVAENYARDDGSARTKPCATWGRFSTRFDDDNGTLT
jgi:hypothetical protein